MNFLTKTVILAFVFSTVFSIIILIIRWNEPPLQLKRQRPVTGLDRGNLLYQMIYYKRETALDLENEWKKVANRKILK